MPDSLEEHNVAKVCDAIAQIKCLTTMDAFNILFALRLRNACTPIKQQGRADVARVLEICQSELADIWTRLK